MEGVAVELREARALLGSADGYAQLRRQMEDREAYDARMRKGWSRIMARSRARVGGWRVGGWRVGGWRVGEGSWGVLAPLVVRDE